MSSQLNAVVAPEGMESFVFENVISKYVRLEVRPQHTHTTAHGMECVKAVFLCVSICWDNLVLLSNVSKTRAKYFREWLSWWNKNSSGEAPTLLHVSKMKAFQQKGPIRESNPGPPAPKAGIMPLDQSDVTSVMKSKSINCTIKKRSL